jgi:hypothetical protein
VRKSDLLLQSSMNKIESIAFEILILLPDSQIFGGELHLALQ